MIPFVALLVLLLGTCTAAAEDGLGFPGAESGPEQVHLSYGDAPDEMWVTWASREKDAGAYVAYQPSSGGGGGGGGKPAKAAATLTLFGADQGNPAGAPYVYRAVATGLVAGAEYDYQVVMASRSSPMYSFVAMPTGSDYVLRLAVYGDLGRNGTSPTLPLLAKEAKARSVDAIIHVGDFAYDLQDEGGERGDRWMRAMAEGFNITTLLPMQTAVGNHEIFDNFTQYVNRFTMPMRAEGNSMWYSWTMHLARFICLTSEPYFTLQSEMVARQMAWLQEELKTANADRDAHPWLIVYFHRPMYCSNDDGDDCTRDDSIIRAAFEEVLYDGGADFIIQAHEHSYEALWPVFNNTVVQKNYINPRAPTMVVTGAAGCNEDNGLCLNPILGPRGPWSAFRAWFFSYGYAHLNVYNSTHLHFEQLLDESGRSLHEFWLVQEKHGPFGEDV